VIPGGIRIDGSRDPTTTVAFEFEKSPAVTVPTRRFLRTLRVVEFTVAGDKTRTILANRSVYTYIRIYIPAVAVSCSVASPFRTYYYYLRTSVNHLFSFCFRFVFTSGRRPYRNRLRRAVSLRFIYTYRVTAAVSEVSTVRLFTTLARQMRTVETDGRFYAISHVTPIRVFRLSVNIRSPCFRRCGSAICLNYRRSSRIFDRGRAAAKQIVPCPEWADERVKST